MTAVHSPVAELDAVGGPVRRIDLLSGAHVVDDRSLLDNPADVLASVEQAREQSRIVAVADVGVRPESLSLLPLIEPDIIVLAPEMASVAADTAAARTLHVLAAQAERTGAVIVASGVDSEVHRSRALALGARFGSGQLFPPVDDSRRDSRAPDHHPAAMFPTWSTPIADSKSPFDIASADLTSVVSTKKLLIEMSTQIESQASNAGADTLALGTFQHARHLTTATRRRWTTMADRISYTGVYGVGMDASADGIVHSALDPDDPLVEEWNVIVLGQFFCCVLSARDAHRGSGEMGRQFDYVVSHDRGTVVRCARAVLSRFTPP